MSTLHTPNSLHFYQPQLLEWRKLESSLCSAFGAAEQLSSASCIGAGLWWECPKETKRQSSLCCAQCLSVTSQAQPLGHIDLESDDDLMLDFEEVIKLGPALVETRRIGLSKNLGLQKVI
jgi:hypothetical protein